MSKGRVPNNLRCRNYSLNNNNLEKESVKNDIMAIFRSIKELTRALQQGSKLLGNMFLQRKAGAVNYDDALDTLEGDENKLKYLIDHGVIDEAGDSLELSEPYQRFFEEVLAVNEDINIASVKMYIDKLNIAIQSYLAEDNNMRRTAYLKDIRQAFKAIDYATHRNVVDLKRNVDDTYKQEPNFKIKELRLRDFDEKARIIESLIRETERVMEDQTIFFASLPDYLLRKTINDVKGNLRESAHGLIAVTDQIIDYLNRIEYQSELVKKVRNLKYLRDKYMIEQHSDIREISARCNAVWMEPKPKYTTRVSIPFLHNEDAALEILDNIRGRLSRKVGIQSRLAGTIATDYLEGQSETIKAFNHLELLNGFMAQRGDLFYYIWHYTFSEEIDREMRLVLFLQMASQYPDQMLFTAERKALDNIEYPLIYPK